MMPRCPQTFGLIVQMDKQCIILYLQNMYRTKYFLKIRMYFFESSLASLLWPICTAEAIRVEVDVSGLFAHAGTVPVLPWGCVRSQK